MPIRGRTLREAAHMFRGHINQILSRTVTRTPVFVIPSEETHRVHVGFRLQGEPTGASLNTRFAPMRFFFGQVCESVPVRGGLQELRTVRYRYALTMEGAEEAFVRWEYTRTLPEGAAWCRHHLQGPISLLQVNERPLLLTDVHLPTGYVPFEEVLRFCIVDLGVRPLTDEWDATLRESYERFKTEFVQ